METISKREEYALVLSNLSRILYLEGGKKEFVP